MSTYRIRTVEEFNKFQNLIDQQTKGYRISDIIKLMGGDNVKYLIFDFENPTELDLKINLFDDKTIYFDLFLINLKNITLNITFNISNQITDFSYNNLIFFANVENYGKINFTHCKDNDILFNLNIQLINYGIVDIGDYIVYYPYNDYNQNIICCYFFYINNTFYNFNTLKLKKTNKYMDDNKDYIIFYVSDNLFINYKIELETPDIKIILYNYSLMIDYFYETPGVQNKNSKNYVFLNLPVEYLISDNIPNDKEKYEEEIKKLKLKNQLLLLLLAESYNQQSKIQNNDLLKLMYQV